MSTIAQVGETIPVVFHAGFDLTGYTLTGKLEHSDGTEVSISTGITIDGSDDTLANYTAATTDLSKAGTWYAQLIATNGSVVRKSKKAQFTVESNL